MLSTASVLLQSVHQRRHALLVMAACNMAAVTECDPGDHQMHFAQCRPVASQLRGLQYMLKAK